MGGGWRGILRGISMNAFNLIKRLHGKQKVRVLVLPAIILSASNCAESSDKIISVNTISCPYKISASTKFLDSSAIYGKLSDDTLSLINIGITLGYPSDSLSPVFSDEILEDWAVSKQGVHELVSEYSRDRKDDFGNAETICLRCDYLDKKGISMRPNRPVVLLQKLPDNKDARCLLTKDYKNKTASGSCSIK